MHRSAGSIAQLPARDDSGSRFRARLALAEFLLASDDLQASAREVVDWLADHAGVAQSLVALVDPSSPTLLLAAERGLSAAAIADFVISPKDGSNPLVAAMRRGETLPGPGATIGHQTFDEWVAEQASVTQR